MFSVADTVAGVTSFHIVDLSRMVDKATPVTTLRNVPTFPGEKST